MSGNAATVAAFLKGKGLTDAQIAGIMGNWQVESNFSPTATGDGGLAYGIAQWHPDRRPPGGLSSDLSSQLDWFWTEAHTSEASAWQHFLAASSTPEQAAASFDQYYERSDGTARVQREHDADALYPEVSGVTQQSGFLGDIGKGLIGGVPLATGTNPISDTTSALSGIGTIATDVAKVPVWLVQNGKYIVYGLAGAIMITVGLAKMFGHTLPGPLGAVT